jgi:eukaryotic-like serine/threonine-protein kinase
MPPTPRLLWGSRKEEVVVSVKQANAHPFGHTDGIIGHLLGGRYRIVSLIGRGGMASVYRAVDQELPREVAVKLMLPGSADPEEIARQRNEIDTLAALNHHGLVTLYDIGTERDQTAERTFLVMELVDGPNLREALSNGPLQPDQVAHIGADVAEALHYMNGRGVIHRDIKPANILLAHSDLPDRKFHAKLADFGIARLMDAGRLTSTGVVIGTASYLSPEQARGGAVGAASDVYSLGLVLLEALAGEKVFPGTAVESLSARLVARPDVPSALGDRWQDLLTGMTSLDPSLRLPPMDVALAARNIAHSYRDMTSATAIALTDPDHPSPIPYPPEFTSQSTRLYPVADATEAFQHATASKLNSAAPKRLARWGRRRAIAFAVGAVLAVAAGGAAISWATSTPPVSAGSSYPAVSGTLGAHLNELRKSVTP